MANEAFIRLAVFLGLFAILVLLETKLPRKARTNPRKGRWFTNLSITVIDAITINLMAIVLPFLAVGAAIDAQSKGWGLFNTTDLPVFVEVIAAVLILDLLIWAQHLLTHKVPFLWRIHQVHHADVDIDVTTALRFHPIEIALSMLLKIGAIYILGPAALAVILFEIILNGMAMFNHANLKLPLWLDRILRMVVVTPDMHRVHHSVHREEHDTNYGFSLSIWDRIFRTYTPQPKEGHDGMTIGLRWQDKKPTQLLWSLLLPIKNK